MKLTREDIVTAAQALIDAEGLGALNMRALARRLDAQGSALYWHVHNKAELLTLLANACYRRAFDAVPSDLDWPEWLLAFGNALHAELLAHRDAAQVCAIARPAAEGARASLERLAAPLMAKGLTLARALACQSSVIALTLGWATYEQSEGMRTHLETTLDLQASYRQGLEAMVAGLRATA